MIFNYKRAFTLTEVLIATAIVGFIAALVLPMVITTYQNNMFEHMYNKENESIKAIMESLPVTENKSRFEDTMMSSDTISDDTSGLFLKKYFKVAKYCGNITDSGADCFAPEYAVYKEAPTHIRESVKAVDLIPRGTCAQLKNGTSICIAPQPKTRTVDWKSAQVVMDLNGLKGPNVVGRDLRVLEALPTVSAGSSVAGKQQGVEGVFAENETPITPTAIEECSSYTKDSSDGCCLYKKRNNMIKTGDICCTANSKIGPTVAACNTTITLHLNYFPTSSSYKYGDTPYTRASGTFKLDPSSATLPDSLAVKIKCGNGTYSGGTLSATTIMSALANKKDAQWSGQIYDKSCAFPSEDLVWTTNSGTSVTINGITYKISKH